MLMLFFLTTALSGVISMYLTQESPKMSADYDQRVPVIDITHFFRSERDLQNKDDTPTTKKYLMTMGGQTEFVKSKRSGLNRPSLSIVNPLDVLRQKLLLDIDRNRKQSQIDKNREYLQKIGKRSIVESFFSE